MPTLTFDALCIELRRAPACERRSGIPFPKNFQLVGDSGEDLVNPPLLKHLAVVCNLPMDAALSVVQSVRSVLAVLHFKVDFKRHRDNTLP